MNSGQMAKVSLAEQDRKDKERETAQWLVSLKNITISHGLTMVDERSREVRYYGRVIRPSKKGIEVLLKTHPAYSTKEDAENAVKKMFDHAVELVGNESADVS